MKPVKAYVILFAVLICSALSSFKTGNINTSGQSLIAGEWSNTDLQAKLQLIKFFPNGLLNIHTGNSNKVCNYEITGYHTNASTTVVTGVIEAGHIAHPANYNNYNTPVSANKGSMSNDQKTFRATIINGKIMTLVINSDASLLTLKLLKTKSIPSGVMQIQ